ncbi:hypothetical protein [Variovorax sp. J22R115]|uniref:hypothetical protein n=1 Tax=Variovorax sp. J22R115 TaxID=3053509 RepID=UPI002577185A|nr:hypothetical protein [Variovorax sp. J22R115]MDM0052022.1 hypothetical protein [Variovorax sp. J22R115]
MTTDPTDPWEAIGDLVAGFDDDQHARFVDKISLHREGINFQLTPHLREMVKAGVAPEVAAASGAELSVRLLGIAAISIAMSVKQASLIGTQAEMLSIFRRRMGEYRERLEADKQTTLDALQESLVLHERQLAELEARLPKNPVPRPTEADCAAILRSHADLMAVEPTLTVREVVQRLREICLPPQPVRASGAPPLQFTYEAIGKVIPARPRGRPKGR